MAFDARAWNGYEDEDEEVREKESWIFQPSLYLIHDVIVMDGWLMERVADFQSLKCV